MEDALVPSELELSSERFFIVLILVLMEDALVHIITGVKKS